MNISIKVTALIGRGERILLIKEWSKKRQGYFWNVIKGTYDGKKDSGLVSAAIREAREEVSLPILVTGLASVFVLKRGEDTTIQFNFHCRIKRNTTPRLKRKYEKDEDIAEFRWFSKSDFLKLKPQSLFSKRTRDVLVDYFANNKLIPTTILKNINESQ